MREVVLWMNDAMAGAPWIALVASLLWGIASVLLSPCHLGTIPLVVAYVGTSEAGAPPTRWRAAGLSFAFAGGMLAALSLLGVLVTVAGWAVAGLSGYTNYVMAAVFILAGLYLLGFLSMPEFGGSFSESAKRGPWGAAVLGAVFGVSLSPCTFAFLAPVLAAAFSQASTSLLMATLFLLAFGLGHCVVIGIAGASIGWVQRYLNWNAQSRGLALLKGACGVLLLLSASLLLYSA